MASGTNPEQGRLSSRTGPDRPPLLTWRDINGSTRRYADELIATEAESTALEALRSATGEVHGDMERHTMRQYLIAERIADMRGVAYDRELLLCASFLHDSGRPARAMCTSRTRRAMPGERSSHSAGPITACVSASMPASSTMRSERGGGCPTRSSWSAVPTSSKWCPSSCAGASPDRGSSASCGTRYRAPATGRLRTRFCGRAGGGCFRGCSGRRRPAGRPTESSSERRGSRITSAWVVARSGRRPRCQFGGVLGCRVDTRTGVRRLHGGLGDGAPQVLVDEGDRHAALAYGGGDAFHRPEPDVA